MTQKELQRLRRQDLLELLLAQGEESERISAELEECRKKLESLEVTYERIRKRLDVKDTIIHELKESLEAERTQRLIKLEDAGSIAEASLRLNGIFEAAQEAADQYLYNIQMLGKRQTTKKSRGAKLTEEPERQESKPTKEPESRKMVPTGNAESREPTPAEK